MSSDIPDKNYLYGKFEAGEERKRQKMDERDAFAHRLAHKAVDMPLPEEEEKMKVDVNRSVSGLTWQHLAAAGVIGLGALGLSKWDMTTPAQPAPAPQSVKATAEAEFSFYQRRSDGKLVPVDIERIRPEDRKNIISQ